MKQLYFAILVTMGVIWLCSVHMEIRADPDPEEKTPSQKKGKRSRSRGSVRAPGFRELRQRNIRRVDSRLSLALLAKALRSTDDEQIQAALLRGMLSGLEGHRKVAEPEGWQEAKARLTKDADSEVAELTRNLSQLFGDRSASSKALATVRDPLARAEDRRSAMRSLVAVQSPELAAVLSTLVDDPVLQVDAIRAYRSLEDKDGPSLLLARYPKLDFQAKRAVVETLATRKAYAKALLAGIENKTVARGDVPAYIARTLSALLGKRFVAVYGDVRELSKDKAELISRYKSVLSSERLAKADVRQGRAVFDSVCASCHQLYGEGGQIGPDLTGSNRADVDYILLNMLDPSADIPDAYKQVTIATTDGQILVGTLAGEDGQRVTLETVGQRVTVLKSEIVNREVSRLSMMPEGLLPGLQDSQVVDLVKYLQTTKQVALPE